MPVASTPTLLSSLPPSALSSITAVCPRLSSTTRTSRLSRRACPTSSSTSTEVWAKGGEGGKALAEEVIRLAEDTTNDHFQFVYDLEDSIEEKLNKIATKVYRADGVVLAGDAKKQAAQLTELGFDKMPICMAKTQFSFSDDQTKLGAPRGFKITVREIKVNAGAGFLVAKTGNIMTMPGLPKVPASERIDIDANGKITGLF